MLLPLDNSGVETEGNRAARVASGGFRPERTARKDYTGTTLNDALTAAIAFNAATWLAMAVWSAASS